MLSCMCLHLPDTLAVVQEHSEYALTFNQSERSKLLFPSFHLMSLSLNSQCDGSKSVFLSKAARPTPDLWRKWHFVFGTSTKRSTSGVDVVTYRFVGIVASVSVDAFVLFCVWCWNNWTIQLKPTLHFPLISVSNKCCAAYVSVCIPFLWAEMHFNPLFFVVCLCHEMPHVMTRWCSLLLFVTRFPFMSRCWWMTEVSEASWKSRNQPLASVGVHKNCTT